MNRLIAHRAMVQLSIHGLRRLLLPFVLLCSLQAGILWAQTEERTEPLPLPELKTRITDLTGTLTEGEKQQLEGKLEAFQKQKGSQVAVLMLPSTKPEAIEQFSIRLAEAWKVGRKNTDDGIILVIAKNDRKMRIEVGYGLEGALPDASAKRIIAEVIAPQFKAGDFYQGISEGLDAIIAILNGEKLPEPERTKGDSDDGFDGMGVLIVVAIIVGFLIAVFIGRVMGGLVGGILAFAIGGFILGSFGESAMAGLIAFFAVAFGGRVGGGWSSGGGGFSGGGGGFGGGGSSGSW